MVRRSVVNEQRLGFNTYIHTYGYIYMVLRVSGVYSRRSRTKSLLVFLRNAFTKWKDTINGWIHPQY